MSNLIPEATARALKDARQLAFEANMRTSKYADGINDLANENDGSVIELAELAAENDGSIMDIAEILEAFDERITALENK